MIVLHVDPLLFWAVGILCVLCSIMTILVGLNLSRKLSDHYADIREVERDSRRMASETWRYIEAVDDIAARGAGNTLFRERVSRSQASPRKPVRH